MRIRAPRAVSASGRTSPSIVDVFRDCGGTTASHYGIIIGLLIFAAALVWASAGPQLANLFRSL